MKAAIVVLADTETHEALGRAVNAMVTALDFKESGDDVQLIFDGGGTRWPPVLADKDHQVEILGEQMPVGGVVAVLEVLAGTQAEPQLLR